MKKSFTLLQLANIITGAVFTNMDDIYDILNHVCDDNLSTHHLPVALDYLRLKNPQWLIETTKQIEDLKGKMVDPKNLVAVAMLIEKEYPNEIEIPQLKDEVDVSDFAQYMIKNSLLVN